MASQKRFNRFLHVPGVPIDPPPPKASLDDADLIPEATANFVDILTFGWVTGLLGLGYARPLEDTDLYKLQDHRSSQVIADKILASFDRRQEAADAYNTRLAAGEIKPGWRSLWWTLRGNRPEREKRWRQKDGRQRASLAFALNDSIAWWYWSGGLLKLSADITSTLSPLVVKALISFGTTSYYISAHQAGAYDEIPPIGRGVGLAIGLLLMQVLTSLCTHHFFYRATSTGVLLRGGLITAIYSRSLRLTTRARTVLTNGKLVNHISTDVSRIDFCCGFMQMGLTAPVQMAICLVILIINLGPSALAGFAFFVLCTPLQTLAMRRLMRLRMKSMGWTDKRSKLLQELLGGMKIIKYFSWEVPYLRKVEELRGKEMGYIRNLLLIRSANNAIAISLPTLASVLSFIVYSLAGHSLNAADIFSSLTLFNLLRMPLMFLPLAISSTADAQNAIERLYGVFEAEIVQDTQLQDPTLPVAVDVVDASLPGKSPKSNAFSGLKNKKRKKGLPSPSSPTSGAQTPKVVDRIFSMSDITLSIPRGQLCAIVGPVGSGKTSLLQAIIGEMRRTSGRVAFNGSIAYCPQSAWIQNATVRENICFGRAFDEARTGGRLSGGQKQRLNICRAIYVGAEIQIFDDPLSALDAHVGRSVFQNVLLDAPAGTTRILVTHALHFLPQVDYICTVVDGRLAERGTYAELLESGGEFSRFVREFGAKEKREEEEEDVVEEVVAEKKDKGESSVNGAVYRQYMHAGRGEILVPLLILSVALLQGTQVMSSYWLVYWEENKWPYGSGFYMGIYAGLGVGQAISFFFVGLCFALLTYIASKKLHNDALTRVMYAPMSFFETTPLGRIMNRIDTVDNLLSDSMRMLVSTLATIVGAIILIGIVIPWFLIAVGAVLICYVWAAFFYRASARELKRLDAILRSSLYSHFSESLSGLATIRAYGETSRFLADNRKRVDIENRAYWLTVTNQRWLGIRLDMMGIILTFVVAILSVASRYTISPSQMGVVLSYIISVQQAFGWLVRQTAEVENDFNSVERIIYYANELEQESPHSLPDRTPPAPWPPSYRPELPAVIKGLSMSIRPGEKVGIVGRTGAGKSSIMTALYRLVELTSGSIVIDGVDISTLGLGDLRQGLAIIPQDPVISGTLRSNLDPFGYHDDARLWDALKRAYLSVNTSNRFSLDSPIEDEGGNLSIGQRSLVSLARALVKESKILILDEATASVDYETDRKIQDTIAVEFRDRTILCIAHRLRTIIGYDRICVMDAGGIAEFDTPANLYRMSDGIFRGMCERSTITLEDILYAAKARMVDEKRVSVEAPMSTHSDYDEKAGTEVDEV
ncbi:ABC transporter [Fomitopsis serialis]|uniref:ABC transporter n=1 Tax=Fomitopsis serialis TaxID=139415 RepID=UPI0020074CF5|nr:ABC transporter [Neoantrodia serialis]KAH9928634.1 ABC transporter [Neoantrodia serialis]